MLWKISVMRIHQAVKRETLIGRHEPETCGNCMTAESDNDERFTVLSPRCDRPAAALRRARHAPYRVNHLGVPDQFKNVGIAWAIAIGVGASQIEAHFLSMGEDQFTLATTIGQGENQRAGIDGIPLLRFRREDRGHVQELRKGHHQKIRRAGHKNQLVTGLSMLLQPRATLQSQLADHLGLTELPRIRFNVCGALTRQIHFSFPERVQRKRGDVPRQPGRTPAQLAPSHQTTPPQKPKESYFAGLSRQERIVDVEQRSDRPLCPSFSDIIEKRRSEDVVTLHSVEGPGEYEPPDSTGQSFD